ncbi:MAG: DMT family transporter [Micromonosporaceae bacterium]
MTVEAEREVRYPPAAAEAAGHDRGMTKWLPTAAIAVAVVLWASAFVAIRHVGQDVTPGALALGRLLVASVVLGGVLLLWRPRAGGERPDGWPRGSAWLRVLACGVMWFGVYNVALNEAERRVDAGTAAMLVNIGPILIAVLAGWLLAEGLPRRLLLGCAVAFGGVLVIGLSTSPGGTADLWGVALCLVSAVGYAVGVVAQKPLLEQSSALRVTWLACTVGTVVCLPYAPALLSDLRSAGPAALAWVVYLGLMPTALAFTTWAYALSHSTAGQLGVSTYLVPPVAIGLGWALLGETPAGLAYLGGVICLLGVYLSRRKS